MRLKQRCIYRYVALLTAVLFVAQTVLPVSSLAQSQDQDFFHPALIMGLNIHPENPWGFDFVIDPGNSSFEGEAFREESTRLIKYFLASLTIPEKQMWVTH